MAKFMKNKNLKNTINEKLEEIPKEKRVEYLQTQIKLFKAVVKDQKMRESCNKLKRIYSELEEIVQQLEEE